MSTISIHITVEPQNGGRPISLARVTEREVLQQAAHAAVRAAQADARRVRNDPLLALIQDDEVSRLERYFGILIPGFAGEVRPAA